MKMTFDKEADALYIKLNDSEIIDSEEIWDGVNYDYGINDTVAGIEVVSVKEQSKDLYKKIAHLLSAEELSELSQLLSSKLILFSCLKNWRLSVCLNLR